MSSGPGSPCLEARGLCKSFGGVEALVDLSLTVKQGEIHAVIGPNGAGKTTLVHVLSGLLRPDAGHVVFDGKDITHLSAPARVHQGLARSFQITSIFRELTVLENVILPVQGRSGHSFRFWQPVMRDSKLLNPGRRTPRTGRARRDVLRYEPRILHMANSGSWRLRLRWQHGRQSCSLMNRWLAWDLRRAAP